MKRSTDCQNGKEKKGKKEEEINFFLRLPAGG
jgi:hypothetical protein